MTRATRIIAAYFVPLWVLSRLWSSLCELLSKSRTTTKICGDRNRRYNYYFVVLVGQAWITLLVMLIVRQENIIARP